MITALYSENPEGSQSWVVGWDSICPRERKHRLAREVFYGMTLSASMRRCQALNNFSWSGTRLGEASSRGRRKERPEAVSSLGLARIECLGFARAGARDCALHSFQTLVRYENPFVGFSKFNNFAEFLDRAEQGVPRASGGAEQGGLFLASSTTTMPLKERLNDRQTERKNERL